MNLLYWSPFYAPDKGGIETIAGLALPRLVTLGYNVRVVASFGRVAAEPVTEVDGVTVHRFPFRQWFNAGNHTGILKLTRTVARLKREFRPDVVHLNLSDPSVLLHLATDAASVPMLVALHTEWTRVGELLKAGSAFKRAVLRADWITSVSRAGLRQCTAVLPELATRSSVEVNGIDPSGFDPDRRPAEVPTLLYCGRLVTDKGVDQIIRVMRRITAQQPDARLVIAGDGPERPRLERLAADIGVAGAVRFEGFVDAPRVATLMAECRAVLMASRFGESSPRTEGLPMVLLEAGAAARPAVAFAAGGTAEVIDHDRTGIVLESEDVEAFAAAATGLLADPERARRMGRAARRRIEAQFSIERYVDRYDRLYRMLRDRRS